LWESDYYRLEILQKSEFFVKKETKSKGIGVKKGAEGNLGVETVTPLFPEYDVAQVQREHHLTTASSASEVVESNGHYEICARLDNIIKLMFLCSHNYNQCANMLTLLPDPLGAMIPHSAHSLGIFVDLDILPPKERTDHNQKAAWVKIEARVIVRSPLHT
jgi:hypothetical protein